MKYVVYCRGRDMADAGYWNGGFLSNGKPGMADTPAGAASFPSARQAYEEAGKHRPLWVWRVGRRNGA